MKKLVLIFLSSILLTFSLYANAVIKGTKQSLENDALSCSAMFYIMTSIENENYNKMITKISMSMRHIYGWIASANRDQEVTNGFLSDNTGMRAKELGKIYDRDNKALSRIYAQCNTWRGEVSEYLLSLKDLNLKEINKNNSFNIDRMKNVVAKFPTVKKYNEINIPPHKEEIYDYQVKLGMKAWDKLNRLTTKDFKKKLLEIMRK